MSYGGGRAEKNEVFTFSKTYMKQLFDMEQKPGKTDNESERIVLWTEHQEDCWEELVSIG